MRNINLILYFLLCISLGISLSFCFVVVRVNDDSMAPTLLNGEYLLVNRKGGVDRGDVVVFGMGDRWLVKRVFAKAGDRVLIDNSGRVQLISRSTDELSDMDEVLVSVVVPPGYVYLLGDNKNKSIDSRKHGFVREIDINGVLVFPRREG